MSVLASSSARVKSEYDPIMKIFRTSVRMKHRVFHNERYCAKMLNTGFFFQYSDIICS